MNDDLPLVMEIELPIARLKVRAGVPELHEPVLRPEYGLM